MSAPPSEDPRLWTRDEILDLIRRELTVDVTLKKERDYGDSSPFLTVRVTLELGGAEISTRSDFAYLS